VVHARALVCQTLRRREPYDVGTAGGPKNRNGTPGDRSPPPGGVNVAAALAKPGLGRLEGEPLQGGQASLPQFGLEQRRYAGEPLPQAGAEAQDDNLVAPLQGRRAPGRHLAAEGPRHHIVDGIGGIGPDQDERTRRRVPQDPVGEIIVSQYPAPRRAAQPTLELGPSSLLGEVVDEAGDLLGVQDVSRRHGSCFLSAGLVGQVTAAA
jgi:hypothetical protein